MKSLMRPLFIASEFVEILWKIKLNSIGIFMCPPVLKEFEIVITKEIFDRLISNAAGHLVDFTFSSLLLL